MFGRKMTNLEFFFCLCYQHCSLWNMCRGQQPHLLKYCDEFELRGAMDITPYDPQGMVPNTLPKYVHLATTSFMQWEKTVLFAQAFNGILKGYLFPIQILFCC